jgi:hypothetical protein
MGGYLIRSRVRVKNRGCEPPVRTLPAATRRLILTDGAYNADKTGGGIGRPTASGYGQPLGFTIVNRVIRVGGSRDQVLGPWTVKQELMTRAARRG